MATSSVSSTSNIDVNGIVSQLMMVERRPMRQLDIKEAGYQARLTAYGSIKGAIASFQSAVQGLNNVNLYQSLKATSSDSSIFSASATATAVAGTYSLEVSSLTQAQKLVSAGHASSSTAIGTGTATTLTFEFGTISGGTLTPFDPATNSGGTYSGATFTSNGTPSKSITIDSSNNSLQGIRDAINAAQLGVTATLINDGSGTPYRLSLSSNNSGVSNSLKISAAAGGDASITSLLAHDPAASQGLSQTVAAQNANFTVNGVAISKTSNSISDVIEGVTLNLNKVTTGPVNLTVARDTTGISTAVKNFIKAYNDLSGTLKSNSAYDPATKQGAILQGDSTVRQLQNQLRNMLNNPVVGTSGALTSLSSIGVSFTKEGVLTLDQTKLDKAINSNPGEIASLFAAVGKPSDSLISFSATSGKVQAGSYAVNITQIATQGNALGSALTLPTTIVAGVNDTLDLSVNGVSTSITLSAGSYGTAQALAAELQARINGSATLAAASAAVTVNVNGGALSISSQKYGSSSSVTLSGGTAQTDLGLLAATQTTGVDVAGTIGGAAATGDGQKLLATAGGAAGLSIIVNGGALGERGTLSYSHGYAFNLDQWATASLGSDSLLSGRTKGIDASIKDIGNRRIQMEQRMLMIEQNYRKQFVALDTMLSSMNQTSLYLTQQLAKMQ